MAWTMRDREFPKVVTDQRPPAVAADFRLIDPEVAALNQVLVALKDLSPRARERILRHVADRFDDEDSHAGHDPDDPA